MEDTKRLTGPLTFALLPRYEMKATLEHNAKRLRAVVTRLGQLDGEVPPDNSIRKVVEVVLRAVKRGCRIEDLKLTPTDLRALAFAFAMEITVPEEAGTGYRQMSILSTVQTTDYALALIGRNPSVLKLKGLYVTYLSVWDHDGAGGGFARLRKYLLDYFAHVKSPAPAVALVGAAFFDYCVNRSGPGVLAKKLMASPQGYSEAAAREALRLPQETGLTGYLEELRLAVIEAHAGRPAVLLERRGEFVPHSASLIVRQVYAITLEHDVERVAPQTAETIYTTVVDLLGDPYAQRTTKWQVAKARFAFAKPLAGVQERTLAWMNRAMIRAFFTRCTDDERREKFWIAYSSIIQSFHVFGPDHHKRALKDDPNIAPFVDARFSVVGGAGSMAAFLLEIGNYQIVEFGDKGAMYCYRRSSSAAFSAKMFSRISSVNDLKRTSLAKEPLARQSAGTIYILDDEGRFLHKDHTLRWEVVLHKWARTYLLKP